MVYGKNEPGERCNALRAPGVEKCAPDIWTIANSCEAGKARLCVHRKDDGEICHVIGGRDLWALRELMKAGAAGVTPIDCPAPRWSAYVFNLRALGLKIETIHVPHGVPFPGTHARYVLRSSFAIEGGCYASV